MPFEEQPDEPPREVLVELDIPPISLQGAAAAKGQVREAVRAQCEQVPYLFCGEVYVEIEWRVHERYRWDTPGVLRTPDIDNIVKPLIDGLCGQRGIMIDDCQVQSLACSWIDWLSDDQRVTVRVRPLHPDDVLARGLVGVERDDGFCWILPTSLAPESKAIVLDGLTRMRDKYEDLVSRGMPEHDAKYFLPIARRFHRSQLIRHGFPVLTPAEFTKDSHA